MRTPTAAALFPAAYGSNGMLGALRDLGRASIPTLVPQVGLASPLRFSRFVTGQLPSPLPALGLPEQLDWLRRIGREQPGSALLTGTDSITWLIAEYHEELKDWYRLYYPSGDAMYTLLNKERLHFAAEAAGLRLPRSWFPASTGEAEELAGGLSYPVLVKPRTHVGTNPWFKGTRVDGPDELRRSFSALSSQATDSLVSARDQNANLPFIQAYHEGAASGVYNLCGFITRDQKLAAFDASWKVLQQPRRLGIGVCFEAAPVDEALASRIHELARQTGFFGMFEAEFIQVDGEYLLTDFNPRVFNSISFAAARGLRLTYLWYQSALGNFEDVARDIECFNASGPADGTPHRWCHRFALETMVAARLLTFRMSPGEARRWWGWISDSRARTMDAIGDRADPWPGRLNALQHFAKFVRDPRMFVGTFVRD